MATKAATVTKLPVPAKAKLAPRPAEDEDATPAFDPLKPPEGLKLPKTLAATADLLYAIKASRLAAAKALDKLQAQETFLNNFLIDRLPKSESRGIAGKIARVTLFAKTKPTIEDYDKLCAYIKKTGAFELLQRRLGEKAIRERWDANKAVPGIGRFDFIAVSVTKL